MISPLGPLVSLGLRHHVVNFCFTGQCCASLARWCLCAFAFQYMLHYYHGGGHRASATRRLGYKQELRCTLSVSGMEEWTGRNEYSVVCFVYGETGRITMGRWDDIGPVIMKLHGNKYFSCDCFCVAYSLLCVHCALDTCIPIMHCRHSSDLDAFRSQAG